MSHLCREKLKVNCLTCAKKIDDKLSYLCLEKLEMSCLTCAKKVSPHALAATMEVPQLPKRGSSSTKALAFP